MPIYEETYHSWDGRLEDRPLTWWLIARTGVRLLWKKSMFFLLFVSYIPFYARAVQIYLVTRMGDQVRISDLTDRFQVNPKFFVDFLNGQYFFFLLILILVGAGLIANDKKFKAFSIYFSKPVGFWDYVGGKWMILGFYGSLVTLVPGLLLFLMRVLLAQDSVFLKTHFWILPALIGFVLIQLLVLGGGVLAVSSAAKGSRSAAIFFFVLIMFPEAFRQFLYRIPEVGLVSMNADLRQLSAFLFGLEPPHDFSVVLAWLALIVVAGLSVAVLKKKVRPTEVVR